jgi:hypothetical protein
MPLIDPDNSLILLGAGASCPAGVPTALAMTSKMLTQFGDDELQRLYLRAIRTLIGGLQMASGGRGGVSGSEVDIERVLSAAQLLSTRFDTEIAPFVGGWHLLLEELERAYTAIPFKDIVKIAGVNALAEIASRLSQPPGGKLFQELITVLTAKLLELTWLTDSKLSAYLHPLVKLGHSNRFTIATLNYDNTVELAAGTLNISCCTGLTEWVSTGCLPEPVKGIDLLKLHGSINWKWSSQRRTPQGIIPHRTICELNATQMLHRRKSVKLYDNSDYVGRSFGVIFGGDKKLIAEGPFFDLFYKFKRLLWTKAHLVVIGYSFRDDHINYIIDHWFTTHNDVRITIVGAPGSSQDTNLFCQLHKAEIKKRLFYDNSGVNEALSKLPA